MKRKFLFALALAVLLPQFSLGAGEFSDLSSNSPNYQAIVYLKEKGIISGYADGTFKETNEINRAEVVKMLLLGAKIPISETGAQNSFVDITSDAWYANYVFTAKQLGIVQGNPNGAFLPGSSTNLAEFLKILLETYEIESKTGKYAPYADVPLGEWYTGYFETAKELNLLDNLSNSNVYPAHAVTRGEIAQLIYRINTGYHQGIASYYGNGINGSKTASGEILNNSDFVMAHKRLPFGSWAKITNLENGKTINARVIDRGPYVDGRVVDLSQAAFQALAPLSAGVTKVSVLPLSSSSPNCPSSELSSVPNTGFSSILLNSPLKRTYIEGEEMLIEGQLIDSNAATVSLFLLNEANEEYVYRAETLGNNFQARLVLPKAGEWKVGLIPGETGTSDIYTIKVLDSDCAKNESDLNLSAPKEIKLNIEKGDLKISWEKGVYNFFRLKFTQNGKERIFLTSKPSFTPPYYSFSDFQPGEVNLSVEGSITDSIQTLNEETLTWSSPSLTSFVADFHQNYTFNNKQVTSILTPNSFSPNSKITLKIDPLVNLNKEAWVIFPNDEIQSFNLISSDSRAIQNDRGTEVFPASSNELRLEFTPRGAGIHQVELNNEEGIASINIPIYPHLSYPLLPNSWDFPKKKVDLGSDLIGLRQQFLTLVNQDRSNYDHPPVVLDEALSQLAQARADDMAKNHYFSHWSPEGKTANDLKQVFGIRQNVSENLVQEMNLSLAESALMESALHRVNLLNSEWTRVGFGVAKGEADSYIFVQLFSVDPIDMNDLESLRGRILETMKQNQSADLSLNESLNRVAQSWSERMAEEDFFGFTAKNGDTLVQQVYAIGIKTALGTYLMGSGSFEGILEEIEKSISLPPGEWKNLGVGLTQDSFGIIKTTLIYGE